MFGSREILSFKRQRPSPDPTRKPDIKPAPLHKSRKGGINVVIEFTAMAPDCRGPGKMLAEGQNPAFEIICRNLTLRIVEKIAAVLKSPHAAAKRQLPRVPQPAFPFGRL
jgi:hypothetical protein